MKTLTVRVDLEATPWPTEENRTLGHGEAAMLVRLLDLARHRGLKYHFFVTTEVMSLFPAAVESVLGDLHDLDWLGDGSVEGWGEAQKSARRFQHVFEGYALRAGDSAVAVAGFVCGAGGDFEVNLTEQEAFFGDKPSAWVRQVLKGLEGIENGHAVWRIRPQVLGHTDSSLTKVAQVLGAAKEMGFSNRTLREITADVTGSSPSS